MKKIEMYEAFDGTRFNSAAECLKYEEPVRQARHDLKVSIHFKDREGNDVPLPFSDDEEYVQKFYEALNRADTCEIIENISYDAKIYLKENIGDMPTVKGFYRYNWDAYTWIAYEDELYDFLNNWHITFDELVKMGI